MPMRGADGDGAKQGDRRPETVFPGMTRLNISTVCAMRDQGMRYGIDPHHIASQSWYW